MHASCIHEIFVNVKTKQKYFLTCKYFVKLNLKITESCITLGFISEKGDFTEFFFK